MRKQTVTLQIEYEGHEDVEDTDGYHDMVREASDLATNHNVSVWVEEEDRGTRSAVVAYLTMEGAQDG